ncbi:hypothetical protein CR513_20052, partial [Mucuna pruriens]
MDYKYKDLVFLNVHPINLHFLFQPIHQFRRHLPEHIALTLIHFSLLRFILLLHAIEATPSSNTTITTKRVMVGPTKQMAYIDNSPCISPIDRDCVGSKLDFNASNMPKSLDKSLRKEVSTSKSDKKIDRSNIDFSDLDLDCLFGEILNDLEISSFKDIDFSDLPNPTHSKDNAL